MVRIESRILNKSSLSFSSVISSFDAQGIHTDQWQCQSKGRAGGASKMLPRTSEEGALFSIRGIVPAHRLCPRMKILFGSMPSCCAADFAAYMASSVVSRSNVTGSALIFNACSKVRFS